MFVLSRRSKSILNKSVHPDLVKIVHRAIQITKVDFTVLSSTIRTVEQQKEYVNLGKSRTMNSRHLPNKKGYVCAVDLAALLGKRVSWREEYYFDIAEAMQKASKELNIDVEWGGCWANLNSNQSIEELHYQYVKRKRSQGKRPFFDGPHFQLPWSQYP